MSFDLSGFIGCGLTRNALSACPVILTLYLCTFQSFFALFRNLINLLLQSPPSVHPHAVSPKPGDMKSLRLRLDVPHSVSATQTPSPVSPLEQSNTTIVDYECHANAIKNGDHYLETPPDFAMTSSSGRSLSLRTNDTETSNSSGANFEGHSPSTSYSSSSSIPMELLLLKMAESDEDISFQEHGYSQRGVICHTLQGIFGFIHVPPNTPVTDHNYQHTRHVVPG